MNIGMYNKSRKKTPTELQEYLNFLRRGFKVQAKKGKGAYSRKQKHKEKSF